MACAVDSVAVVFEPDIANGSVPRSRSIGSVRCGLVEPQLRNTEGIVATFRGAGTERVVADRRDGLGIATGV
jgi:hypothetical protein